MAHVGKAIDGHVSYSAYAVSPDGKEWERPMLGVLELGGRRDHSIVLLSDRGSDHESLARKGKKAAILSVVLHPHPKDESEKYVCLFFDEKKRGAFLGYSADGFHWRREPEPFWSTPVDVTNWGDDKPKSLFYDKFKKRWALYRRAVPHETERLIAQPGDENWQMPDGLMRVQAYADSADLKTWENHQINMIPDADDPADVQFYSMSCRNYEQVYVGFLRVYHGAPDKENIDTQLITSRDGIHFTRCCRREVFLPAGAQGSFDYMLSPSWPSEPTILNDEVYVFYGASNYCHRPKESRRPDSRQATGLATFWRDRFVSLQTGWPQPCRVVTKPFVVEYPKLFLNAATWGDGSIRAEVLTRDWKPIEGFTMDESGVIKGNALAHPLRWKDHADLGPLVGKEVRLKFYMIHSRVHAMIQETEDRPPRQLSELESHADVYAQGPVET